MKQRIRELFDSQALLNDEEWDLFSSKLEYKTFQKGDMILAEGEVEKYLSFIVSGSLRHYVYDHKSDEVSIAFCSRNNFCSSYNSFIRQAPSIVSVQALEDLELLRMSYVDLQELYACSHTGERLGRINAELYLCHKEEREIMLLTMSAQERYVHLLENNPKLLDLVKLEHLATYLGITPQSLSRIRRVVAIS
jgi:CRP/FNR family transcriptional regulator, anaerobic regulatory protein